MFACLLILVGLIALVVGAELLVRGSSRLAGAFGISPLIIGLTVVAFGTSAPELAVSVSSALSGQADIAIGNVVGSNIFNVLFILGLSALIVPLVVDQKLIRFDVPMMVIVSLIMWGFAADRQINRVEGAILFAGLLAYTVWCIVVGRRESAAVRQEYQEAFGPEALNPSASAGDPAKPLQSAKNIGWQLGLVIVGLVLLVIGANWLVDGATGIARGLGISELLIGLTIVAGGTSLPELATSIVAAIRGERDIAVGNVVGSNIFNMLGVLGLSAVVSADGIAVASQAMQLDIPVMIVVCGACLPLFFTGHLIARWEGALFFGYYLIYTVALVLIATNSESLSLFRLLVTGFVIPLTVITLLVVSTRAIHQMRSEAARRRFIAGTTSRPRVVVIGGGFGGLRVVQHLAGMDLQITLLDRRNFHLFQPLLYQVATGSLSPANISAPLRHLLRRQWNVEVRMGEVRDIDLANRVVQLSNEEQLPYDHLVVAAGVRHSYFGHPEWESVAPGLKSIEDATEIRRRILTSFEAAEHESDAARRRELLTFVIIGSGPTGVELAGSLGEIARHTMDHEFRRINPAEARIILVEAADRILTTYAPELSASAQRALEKLGVTVACRTRVTRVHEGELVLATDDREETLRASTILWAAGIEASPLAQTLANQSGAALDRAGRIRVQPDLTLDGHPEVFVIGDMADCRGIDNCPLPGIAPVAIQQGKYVAGQIRRQIRGGTSASPGLTTPFHYRHRGSLATIGRSAAVAEIGRWKVTGFTAWMLWLVIHVANLSLFENRVLVFVQWIWSFVTFGRSARLITGIDTSSQHRIQESQERHSEGIAR